MSIRDLRPLGFAFGLAALHAWMWVYASRSDGFWYQGPATDSSADLMSALVIKRAIEERGIAGLVAMWVHHSPIHTPVVPTVSALLMLLFGESYHVAEAALPLFTVPLVYFTFRVFERLYDAATGYWTAALVTCFPVFLGYSRVYLHEHPLAGTFAAACWAMLRTEGFTRTGWCAGFGALAGLASLTRTGAPAFLVGPTIVAAAVALREAPRLAKLARLGLATGVALALAATWYGPNFASIASYLYGATYGSEAQVFTGGSSFSFENFEHYARSLLFEGPGIPMAAIAVLAWIVGGATSRGRSLVSGTMAAIGVAFAIDFALLLVAAQRTGARYFQPLMPVVAVAVVRAVRTVGLAPLRCLLGAGVAATALIHVVGMTFVPWRSNALFGEHGPDAFPLWYHQRYYEGLCAFHGIADPRADFRVPEAVERLERIGMEKGSRVRMFGEHPFFQANALRLEAVRRRRSWVVDWSPGLPNRASRREIEPMFSEVARSHAVILRTGIPAEVAEETAVASLPEIFDPALRPFDLVGEPIRLGDGSTARVLRQRLEDGAVECAEPPAGLDPAKASFEGAEVFGASAVSLGSLHVRVNVGVRLAPQQAARALEAEIVAFRDGAPRWRKSVAVPPGAPIRVVHALFRRADTVGRDAFEVGVRLGVREGERVRWLAESGSGGASTCAVILHVPDYGPR